MADMPSEKSANQSTGSRVLVLVPNAATGDARVLREAHSLRAAGYDVLLAGLQLANAPGSQALTDQGMPVRRVNWLTEAYLRIGLVYGLVLFPLLIAFLVLFVWIAYAWVIVPLAGGVVYVLQQLAQAGADLPTWAQVIFTLVGLAVAALAARSLIRRRSRFSFSLSSIPLLSRALQAMSRSRNTAGDPRSNEGDLSQVLGLLGYILGLNGMSERFLRGQIMNARVRAFLEVGREFRPDVVHCHEIGTLKVGAILKRELGCRVVYEAHEIYDDLSNASPAIGAQHEKIHKEFLSETDGFVTVNELIGEYYAGRYEKLPAPTIVHNSVYPRDVTYDGRLHEAAGLSRDTKILLYQGGFSMNRGLDHLMEAAFELPSDWAVVFMGWGNHEEALREQHGLLLNASLDRAKGGLIADLGDLSSQVERISTLAPIGDQGTVSSGSVEVQELLTQRIVMEENLSGDTLKRMRVQIQNLRREEALLAADTAVAEPLAKLRASRVRDRARFVPPATHRELVEWTAGATVGIVPYLNVGLNHWYCSPNKLWEYPNAGVPLLTTRLAYLYQTISKWNIGWTMPSDPKASDIVNAIREISDEDLAVKQAACRMFIENSNYTHHESVLLDLFDRMHPA